MKKANQLFALLLALSFLTPTLCLTACNDDTANELQNSVQQPNDEVIEQPPILSTPTNPPTLSTPSDSTQDSQTPTTPESKPDSETVTKPIATSAQYINCTGSNVNLRSGAGTNYAVLGQADLNENYAVLGKVGQWYQIYYKNKPAYLYAGYGAVFTIEQSKNAKVEKVISEGYKLLGVPYVYGAVRLHDGNGNLLSGFTAQKFDCSSLIQYIFYKGADKILQVTTRTQVSQGEYVAKSNLQRGDCMFFTNESRQHLSGVERVGHVALYLGDNYILHTASDYARIEKLTSSRWKFYIQSRRYL